MKILFVGLIIILFSSCCNKKDDRLFYVIKPITLTEDSDEFEFPVFYSYDNFILYNDSTVYYHKINPDFGGRCGTGLDDNKPPFLHLAPSGLVEIPINNLDSFWKKHIEPFGRKRHVTISSPTDTIYNPALLKLKILSGFSSKILLNTRKCTEEQLFVSDAKFQNRPYSANKMKWKFGFDDSDIPPIQETLKFLPPVKTPD